jgi:hypothetical protein
MSLIANTVIKKLNVIEKKVIANPYCGMSSYCRTPKYGYTNGYTFPPTKNSTRINPTCIKYTYPRLN